MFFFIFLCCWINVGGLSIIILNCSFALCICDIILVVEFWWVVMCVFIVLSWVLVMTFFNVGLELLM